MIEPSVRADATVVCLLARHAGRLPLLVFALQYKHHALLNTNNPQVYNTNITSPVTFSQLTSTSAWKPIVTTPDNCYCVCNCIMYIMVYTCVTGWICTRVHTSVPLSERAEGCFWQPCHAVFLKKTKIRHFRQREKLFLFEQKSSLPSRRNIGGFLHLGILQSLNRSIINETEFHLLIIFYCKDLNFFTFTNFANCSTSNLIMLCISGNRAKPICTVDSNNESTSAAVFQKTTQRCHVYKYVGIFADACTRCRNKFRQMRWQIQMQKFAVMRLRMQNPTKVCAAKFT